MASNKDIFNFELKVEELVVLRSLDKGKGSHDPDAPGVDEYLLTACDIHAHD